MIRDLAAKVLLKVVRGEITLEQVRYRNCGGNYHKYLQWYHNYYEKVAGLKQQADELNRKLSLAIKTRTRLVTIRDELNKLFNNRNKVISQFKKLLKIYKAEGVDLYLVHTGYSSNVKETIGVGNYNAHIYIRIQSTLADSKTNRLMLDYANHMAKLGAKEDRDLINEHIRLKRKEEKALQNDLDLYQLFVLLGIF